MKFTSKRFKKPTLLSAAAYIFMLTLVAKGFFLFAIQHPSREELLSVQGIIRKVRLGGDGKSTSFLIESDKGTYRYSSYYGKVWPGMELINPGDPVEALAERDNLNKNELISGKKYYIWELIHNDQVVVAYDDVRDLVEGTETTVNKFVNGILIASAIFLIFAYIRKSSILREK
jgi:hypothetical protein